MCQVQSHGFGSNSPRINGNAGIAPNCKQKTHMERQFTAKSVIVMASYQNDSLKSSTSLQRCCALTYQCRHNNRLPKPLKQQEPLFLLDASSGTCTRSRASACPLPYSRSSRFSETCTTSCFKVGSARCLLGGFLSK